MRKGIMVVMVVLAIMLTMIGIAAATEEDPITFMGTIKDANGNAVSGAEVIIIKDTGQQWIATTDPTGNYSKFRIIPIGFNKEGQYTMKLNGAIVDQRYLYDADFTPTGFLQWSYTWNFQIPEFSTIAIPIVSVIGLLFVLQNKKKKA